MKLSRFLQHLSLCALVISTAHTAFGANLTREQQAKYREKLEKTPGFARWKAERAAGVTRGGVATRGVAVAPAAAGVTAAAPLIGNVAILPAAPAPDAAPALIAAWIGGLLNNYYETQPAARQPNRQQRNFAGRLLATMVTAPRDRNNAAYQQALNAAINANLERALVQSVDSALFPEAAGLSEIEVEVEAAPGAAAMLMGAEEEADPFAALVQERHGAAEAGVGAPDEERG